MKPPAFRATEAIGHIRRLGVPVAGRAIAAQSWSVKEELELVCMLGGRPSSPAARVPVEMNETEPRSFHGFDDELELASGTEYGQALRRVLVCRAGVCGLHVARAEDGTPMYAQWLLRADERNRLRHRMPGPWRELQPDERIVEFAYAFSRHRGKGVMAAGMGRLLAIAADSGASTVYTYVKPDNVPSLRGCAKVGFTPSRIVSTSFRAGFHEVKAIMPDVIARTQWDRAIAPKR